MKKKDKKYEPEITNEVKHPRHVLEQAAESYIRQEIDKDIEYSLDLFDEPLFKGHPFTFFYHKYKQNEICITLSESGQKIPIYNPRLATLLTTKEIKVNRDHQKKDSFNGNQYRETYIKGFTEGVQFFAENFKVSTDILYGTNSDVYIRGLHDQYFHIGKSKFDGWNYGIEMYPVAGITHKEIFKYAYYSGLAHCVKVELHKHGKLFEKFRFDKCIKNKKKHAQGVPQPTLELELFFESISKYKYIMELLVKKGYCNAGNYNWCDEKKSNKATVLSVMKYLHTLGYYRGNKKLQIKQIKEISLNTFGVEVSESYIKQHKTDPVQVNFIPLASTIS